MFINLSTENIILQDQDGRLVLPFHDIEQSLSSACVCSYRKFSPQSIYVLNGPGSFTNLRVGSLIVNTLLLLSSDCSVTVKSLDKLSLYRSAFVQGFLPRYGYIFMGQRKNIWYYDFQESTYVVLSKSEIDSHLHSKDEDSQNPTFFVDLFIGIDFVDFFQGHQCMLDIVYRDTSVIIVFCGNFYVATDLFLHTQKMEPYYAMEPNIGYTLPTK